MTFYNSRILDRTEKTEDPYSDGEVIWFETETYPRTAVKMNGGWTLTGSAVSHSWDKLLRVIGDSAIWVATEWERMQ